MKYYARVSKRVRNVRVYTIVRMLSKNENFMTRLFVRLFTPKEKGPAQAGFGQQLK